MIEPKAIILDIDGVIVGEKIGYNSPSPHPLVIDKLKVIQNQGIPIVLCTAKPHFAIKDIIESANLDNLHITDGGGVVIDPIHQQILAAHYLDDNFASQLVANLHEHQIYTEIYTVDDYFIDKSQVGDITAKHQHVIGRPPQILDSLASLLPKFKVTKIMPIALNVLHKDQINTLLTQKFPNLNLSWGVHPVILPLQFGIITAKGISKAIASQSILDLLHIKAKDCLGVGDSLSDWQFIEPCGYVAAMGNAQPQLKELVQSKGKNGFILPSVDENGILTILNQII